MGAGFQKTAAPSVRPETWWTVAVLFLLYVLSFADRQVISMLVTPIKHDLGLTDFQVSFLMGLSFALLYAVIGVPMGFLADRAPRRILIWCGVTIWAIAACACGLAQTYPALLAARSGVGVGEAALPPCANSLITDKTPRERLALALSLFAMATSVGDALSFMLSGFVLSALKHAPETVLPVVGAVRTWQLVFLITGAPGLLLAPLVFTFREPPRRRPDAASPSTQGFGAWLVRRRRLALSYAGSFCLMGIVAQALTHWAPSYMHRAFHWSPAQYGLALGIVFPVAAVLGHLVCGALVDRMTAQGRADAPMIFFARAVAVCAPVVCAGFIYPHPVVFLASLFLAKAVMTPYLGYGMAGLMSACPQPFRARTAALFMLVLTLLAGGVGPMLIGALTDFVFRDEAKLGWSVASAVAGCSIVAIVALAWGRPALREAAAEARELETASAA